MKTLKYLENKTIENAYYSSEEGSLTIEFTDGTRIIIAANDMQELYIQMEK